MSEGDPIFRRRPDPRRRRLLLALFLSIGVHAGIVACVGLALVLGLFAHPPPPPKPSNVALLNLPPSQWDANRQIGPQKPAPSSVDRSTPPKPVAEKPEVIPKGQVVDVQPGNDQKPPDDAKYLAEHDNKVDKQTHAKNQTAFYKNAMPKRTSPTPPNQSPGHDEVAKKSVAGNEGLGKDAREKQAGKTAGHFEIPDVKKKDKLAVAEEAKNGEIHNQAPSDAVKGNADHLRITPGAPGAPGEAASEGRQGERNAVVNLMPSQATLDRIVGAAPNDHLDDVDEGDGTYLNTREFKYSTFFNRVKQSVGEQWRPTDSLRQRDPSGRIYAYKDRYTMLTVTLDPAGKLKVVTVQKSCGVDFLDEEAVAAFERAQPFPNPPPGLLDGRKEVRFTFGFFLQVDSGSALKIFRSRD